jgi:uncharacterized coiled-coil protein SlyX
MKKLLVASLAALVLALVLSPAAEAKCNVTCLGHRVNTLTTTLIKAQKTIAAQDKAITTLSNKVAAQEQKVAGQGQAISSQSGAINSQGQAIGKVNAVLGCLFEAPLTEYGEPEGPFGYLFQIEEEGTPETFPTTALDVTYENDFVGGWALFDGCNTAETPAEATASAVAPTTSGLLSRAATQAPLP